MRGVVSQLRERVRGSTRGGAIWTFGAPLSPLPAGEPDAAPDWVSANPGWIARAMERALARPAGGWYVLGASRGLGAAPRKFRVLGRDYAVWRDGLRVLAAPDACPHMGASLSSGSVREGKLICPWHGLALGDEPHGPWRCVRAHDDGVLLWLQPEGASDPTGAPVLSPRPARALEAVIHMEARCEPEDVVANRFDPWHGVHFHPHSFARLRVLERGDDSITVRVAYRVVGPLCVEVDAQFYSPQPRAIVMRIVAGDGEGSVVETHATPIEAGRCAIVEATLATSDRPGFRWALRGSGLLRPLMEAAARRLWVEDADYAERRYALRQGR